jgi:hypothetical protein
MKTAIGMTSAAAKKKKKVFTMGKSKGSSMIEPVKK